MHVCMYVCTYVCMHAYTVQLKFNMTCNSTALMSIPLMFMRYSQAPAVLLTSAQE